MAYFKQKTIDIAVRLHAKSGRASWRYKPMTEKQRALIAKYVEPDAVDKIDRGVATVLLRHVFDTNAEAQAWDTNIHDLHE